jgi:hypothetical protein
VPSLGSFERPRCPISRLWLTRFGTACTNNISGTVRPINPHVAPAVGLGQTVSAASRGSRSGPRRGQPPRSSGAADSTTSAISRARISCLPSPATNSSGSTCAVRSTPTAGPACMSVPTRRATRWSRGDTEPPCALLRLATTRMGNERHAPTPRIVTTPGIVAHAYLDASMCRTRCDVGDRGEMPTAR